MDAVKWLKEKFAKELKEFNEKNGTDFDFKLIVTDAKRGLFEVHYFNKITIDEPIVVPPGGDRYIFEVKDKLKTY